MNKGTLEVVRAIGDLNYGKIPGIEKTIFEMLKYRGEAVIDWLHIICNLAWRKRKSL